MTEHARGRKEKARATKAPGREDPGPAAVLRAFRSDPKLASIVDAFEKSSAATGRRKFGSNGLKVNGKLFVLFTQGTLVVKLPKERVSALVSSGVGEPFDPGHGRLMKEWLKITHGKASWVDLALEAHRFVGGKR
jgi:hypothetical protein